MGSIQFFCPNCNGLIAFDEKHAGKQAHCENCEQAFLIPSKNYDTPKKVEQDIGISEPVEGFYRAALIDSFKVFFNGENTVTLLFVTACVCFKFFFGKAICCVNYIVSVIVWGWLLGLYLNIIYETAFDLDQLPKIQLGDSITWLWHVFRPILIFSFTLFVVLLPYLVALSIINSSGANVDYLLVNNTAIKILMAVLLYGGLFFFPMAVLITAVGQEYNMLLRPGCLISPIFRNLFPYLTAAALLGIACWLATISKPYSIDMGFLTVWYLFLNLLVQVFAIVAMRSIGLLHRHYHCNMPF